VRVLDSVVAAADRFGELVRSVPDPAVPVPATPGWSVLDVVRHVSTEPARYAALARGGDDVPDTAAGLPAFNAERIAAEPSEDVSRLAERTRADTVALVELIRGFGDDVPFMLFDGQVRVRSDLAVGTLLGEFLVHGYDIAKACRLPWVIDPADVPLVKAGQHQVLPAWVDRAASAGHTATYEMRLRRHASYIYRFVDGELTVDPPESGPIDAHISVEPVTGLLADYGRIGPVVPVLTGRMVVWGRRPWLAARLPRLFHSP